jgi:hypothetical protein
MLLYHARGRAELAFYKMSIWGDLLSIWLLYLTTGVLSAKEILHFKLTVSVVDQVLLILAPLK